MLSHCGAASFEAEPLIRHSQSLTGNEIKRQFLKADSRLAFILS